MSDSTISRQKILFSTALLCLSLGTFIYAAIIDHWPDLSLGSLLIDLAGFILWLLWIFHLGWVLLRRSPEYAKRIRCTAQFLGAIVGSIILFALVLKLGSFISDKLRLHDIKMAVNAGLRNDCLNLLHHWPATNDVIDGLGMDPSFSKLPKSIKMLEPVSVYKEEIDDTNYPPNIGVCRNGFGGFYGTRVFQNDDDANKYKAAMGDRMFAYERVAPGVYFWVDQ